MNWEKTTKHFFICDDRYRTFSRPSRNNIIDSKVKFRIYFLQIKFLLSLEGHILLVLFCPINLVVAFSLNENKPQLLATFENWVWEDAKQLLNFLAAFESKPLAT